MVTPLPASKGSRPVKSGLLCILALLLSTASITRADNIVSGARGELGVMTGYGSSFAGFGETRHTVPTWDTILRAGFFLSDEVGRGSWYQGRHELLLELPYHMAVDHGGRSMVGGYGLGHWRFTALEKAVPYVFAGGGVLFVDLGLPTMGTRLCFSYQGGTGLQYLIGKDTALSIEYRYHHISNAGTASPNEPLNSNKILAGVSVYY